MLPRISLLLLVLAVAPKLHAEESPFAAAQVMSGTSFTLSSGETLRLIGVDAPQQNEKLAGEAKAKLTSLIAGQKLRLDYNPKGHDSV